MGALGSGLSLAARDVGRHRVAEKEPSTTRFDSIAVSKRLYVIL